MALNGDTMGLAVAAAIASLSESEKEDLEKIWKTACNEIVDHIVTNAVVNTTVTVASVSGVTTGPSASGPGTGSGSGGIT